MSQLFDNQMVTRSNDYKNRVIKRQTTTKIGLIDYKNRDIVTQTTTETGYKRLQKQGKK